MKRTFLILIVICSFLILPTSIFAAGNQVLALGRNYGSGDINTSIDVTNAQLPFISAGYTYLGNVNPTISWVKGSNGSYKRMESDVIYFSGHGNSSGMYFYDAANTSSYTFSIKGGNNSTSVVGLNSYNMSKVKLAVFAGCETGKGNSNIAKTANTKGAKASIGWKVSIEAGSHTSWLQRFWNTATTSSTLNMALMNADSYTYSDNGVKSYNKYGTWTSSLASLPASLTSNNTSSNVENRKFSVNIDINNKNQDEIVNIISNWIKTHINESFNINDYTLEINNNGEYLIYDLVLIINNEIKTKLGYTIFIKDDVIFNIFDNLNLIKNQNKIINAGNQHINKIDEEKIIDNVNKSIDLNKYTILAQSTYKYFDDETLKVYFIVKSILENNINHSKHVDYNMTEI